MAKNKFDYIYGPVSSWRLGASLGIDPVSQKAKVCTFDCSYCQLGRTRVFESRTKEFVPAEDIISEIKSLPPVRIDYLTFSGSGEPTLAKNLGTIIDRIRELRPEKIAVISNSSLICNKDVREALAKADLVMLKLDAHSESLFRKINRPVKGMSLRKIINCIKAFRSAYKGQMALQIMFINANKAYAEQFAGLARKIRPDEVHLNTPLRPCGKIPLTRKEMDDIKKYFKGLNAVSVYDRDRKKVAPLERGRPLEKRGRG